MNALLKTAIDAAEQAAQLIRAYYHGEFTVEIKPDHSPVTIADRKAEELIREIILKSFPEHGFHGEEGGATRAGAEYVWLVDPIDGTKSFIAGYGMFSTQIALMHRGRLILGVSSAPAHDELAWAIRGQGAIVNGAAARVRGTAELGEASISTGNLQSLARSKRWSALGRIVSSANRTRGYGDYYHYHRLAAGQLDAVIESDVNILDIAALSVLVEEAGGIFTDLEGAPASMDTRSVLAATPCLHPKLLAALNEDPGE